MRVLFELLIFFGFLCVAPTATAQLSYKQTQSHIQANAFWAFSFNNGLDFSNSSPPQHVPTALSPQLASFGESIATVSDPHTGSLLFYTSGHWVWDKNHNVMPNGIDLLGNSKGTTRQGACIVPVPGDSSKYYVFSLGSIQTTDLTGEAPGLYYSVIDMTLRGGLGDIDTNYKNIPLGVGTVFTEAMIPVPGNDCNVWLLTHEYKDPALGGSSKYLAFEINASGVNHMPVESFGICDSLSSLNYLAVSPDRNKIAFTDFSSGASAALGITACELGNFNPSTGTVSNMVPFFPFESLWDPTNPTSRPLDHYMLAEFSPNSGLLYAIRQRTYPTSLTILYQFNVSVLDSVSIHSSKVLIDTLPYSATSYAASLKLYNDSLYAIYANNHVIGRVSRPDVPGTGCGFQVDAVSLPFPPYKTGVAATNLPDAVFSYSAQGNLVLDTMACGPVLLRPPLVSGVTSYQWNTSGTDSVLIVDMPGTYWVQYSYFENNCIVAHTDTFKVTSGPVFPEPVINIDVDTLGTNGIYASYQWMKDEVIIVAATDPTYVVTENGEYRVIVRDHEGCIDTSAVYEVTNKSTSVADIRENSEVLIWPNPTWGLVNIRDSRFDSYRLYHIDGRLHQNGRTSTVDLNALPGGLYYLELWDKQGMRYYRSKISKY